MNRFQLLDSVKLNESIPLTDGGMAEAGTRGTIVEVFNQGEAYMVELFDGWMKIDSQGCFIPAQPNEEGAFMQTLGVEVVYPQQLSRFLRDWTIT